MELFILIITLLIFAETTYLTIKKYQPIRTGSRKIYVDTSVLIDGRILNIARTGFISDTLIIPKSVIKELQLLADGKDSEKRSKARTGLDNIAELERVIEVNTEIIDDNEELNKVDDILLKLAKDTKGAILTLDYNLIKVAATEKIETLNINDLALAIKTEFIAGEKLKVKITEKGANKGQGVGHLSDGTMVVVDKAANKIGKTITIELTKFHETPAGKIFFAKIIKA